MSAQLKGAEFGWSAPKFKEQFPLLSDEIAERFDHDNLAMIRLRVRGFMSENERNRIMKRITAEVEKEVRKVYAHE